MAKGLPRSHTSGPPIARSIIKQTFVADGLSVSVVGAAGVGFGSATIGGFPEGNILLLGAVAYLTISGPGGNADLSDTFVGDVGIGTTPMSDATMSDGDEDIIQETALAAATAEVGVRTRATHLAADSGEIHDNTDGSLELNVNVLVDDASIGGTVPMTITGELIILYTVLGDD